MSTLYRCTHGTVFLCCQQWQAAAATEKKHSFERAPPPKDMLLATCSRLWGYFLHLKSIWLFYTHETRRHLHFLEYVACSSVGTAHLWPNNLISLSLESGGLWESLQATEPRIPRAHSFSVLIGRIDSASCWDSMKLLLRKWEVKTCDCELFFKTWGEWFLHYINTW